jgi:eukaryotic-like serine/threonine-protein kinase
MLQFRAATVRERGGQAAVPGQPPLADARGSDSVQQLYLRPLDSLEARAIPNTEGAVNPFFSPDGQWVGFFAGGNLKKISVSGGAAVTLAVAPNPRGASWGSGGDLAFAPRLNGALQQAAEEGGATQPLTQTDQEAQIWPEWLPGNHAVLFADSIGSANWANARIAVQAVETNEQRNLVQGATQPRYTSSLGRQGGHLLYAQAGTLMAAPFDARRLQLTGAAVPVLEQVMVSTATGAAQYSISATGTLVYLAGGVGGGQSRMVWVNRNGEEQLLPAPAHNYLFPSVSPDGRRVAVGIVERESQTWVYDTSRDTLTRLTFEGNENSNPTWTPDGQRITFRSDRTGPINLFWQMADGSGGTEQLTTSEYGPVPSSFPADGQRLAFMEVHPSTGDDIWALQFSDPATAGQAPQAQPFLATPYEETAPAFSPDGRWMAYMSNESGRREIYVQPYPGPGGKWQISTDGGMEPVWNPNGRELFYRSGDTMMAVEVTTQPSFSAGRPRVLFDAGQYLPTPLTFPNYDVSPDGQRFLMLKATEQEQAATQINVVLNWFEELKQRVPTGR